MTRSSFVDSLVVKVACEPGVVLPAYATDGSSGMDLRAHIEQAVILQPQERCLVSTGLRMVIPQGYEAQIRSRSGLALQHGVVVLNSPGTIDASYRGIVKVLLWNSGQDAFVIEPSMRVAQCVFAQCAVARWEVVEDIETDTHRGAGGFGSTGLA